MRSLASATETSLVSTVDISSSSLIMSEIFQSPPSLGISKSLQLSLPVEISAASLPGSVCNFYSVSAPAFSSAWLLPSAPGSSFQPLPGSAHLYQHSSTTTLSGGPGQSRICTPAPSNPGVCEWALTGGTGKESPSRRDFTVSVTEQDTAVSFMSVAYEYAKTTDAHNMAPLYPSLSVSHVQGAPSQIPSQGFSLSLAYQEGSQVYYYNQDTLGPLLTGVHGPYLQSSGSVSYTDSRAAAPHPEMALVPKEVQPTKVVPPAPTAGIYYSGPAQPITKTHFQVMENSLGMETSLALQLPGQSFYPPPAPELPASCSRRHAQMPERNTAPAPDDISMAAPVRSPRNLLALPPAPSQEQKESQSVEDTLSELSKPPGACQMPIENQDPPLFPLGIPDMPRVLACTDPLDQQEQPGCEKAGLGKKSPSLKNQATLENGTESDDSFVDIATLVEGIQLPQVLVPLDDPDQPKGPQVIKTKDTRAIKANEVQKKSSVIKARSDQAGNNKHKASEPISDAPKAKVKPESPDCVCLGEVALGHAAAADGAPANMAKRSNSKPPKAVSSRASKTQGPGLEVTKRTKENRSKKTRESKQAGNKVKAEEKPTIPKMNRKKNQPELTQETIRKPQSSLRVHMLESVQVLHALGKKSEKKTDLSSSRALGNSRNPKGPQPRPVIKRGLDTPREGKSPEKTQGKRQKPDGSAEKESSSPSWDKLPSPGKVKLVPLLFPTMDKPQARRVPFRPQSLASRRPAVANPAQPAALNSSRPTPACSTGPVGPARPMSTNPAQPGVTSPARPGVPQPAASGPAPCKASSCASLQREPVHSAVTQPRAPLKPLKHYLLQDFALQPIPWRKPEILGPAVSKPITNEQRPDREAMKRKAQLERENAAKCSLGKVQHFLERENEMEMSQCYGYAA